MKFKLNGELYYPSGLLFIPKNIKIDTYGSVYIHPNARTNLEYKEFFTENLDRRLGYSSGEVFQYRDTVSAFIQLILRTTNLWSRSTDIVVYARSNSSRFTFKNGVCTTESNEKLFAVINNAREVSLYNELSMVYFILSIQLFSKIIKYVDNTKNYGTYREINPSMQVIIDKFNNKFGKNIDHFMQIMQVDKPKNVVIMDPEFYKSKTSYKSLRRALLKAHPKEDIIVDSVDNYIYDDLPEVKLSKNLMENVRQRQEIADDYSRFILKIPYKYLNKTYDKLQYEAVDQLFAPKRILSELTTSQILLGKNAATKRANNEATLLVGDSSGHDADRANSSGKIHNDTGELASNRFTTELS